MSTLSQDKAFIESLIPSSLLEQAVEWIKSNMSPEDVFDERDLQTWSEHYSLLNNEIQELKETIVDLKETILDLNLSL